MSWIADQSPISAHTTDTTPMPAPISTRAVPHRTFRPFHDGRPQSRSAASDRAASVGRSVRFGLLVAGCSVLGSAWLAPETILCAVMGWFSVFLLVGSARSGRSLWGAYCGGAIGHAIAFHWVYQTVRVFGEFAPWAAGLVFALFVMTAALQLVLFAWIDDRLGGPFDVLAARSATAFTLSELLMPRIFPWHFGHTQIAFVPFVQVAGVGGAMAVTFLTFWVVEAVVRFAVFRERRRALWLPILAFVAALGYGGAMMVVLGASRGERQEIVLVQSDPRLVLNHNLASARENLTHLFRMSRAAARPGSLIVWPEGSVPAYVPANVGTAGNPPILPWIGDGSAFLVGAYSFLPDERRFNTAFAVLPDGAVPFPYFKRVLIPFGEYIPFASYFERLRAVNARAGVFTAGTEARVFNYPLCALGGALRSVKVSPLICYEDTVPYLSRESTRKGAQLLVNLTSDYWFGRSLAPHQHHLIAAFRAIENRRYLVRATTTGVSAVVDPLGKTIARIRPFTEGVATIDVRLLNYPSAYTQWVGDRPWWGLLVLSIVSIAARWRGPCMDKRAIANGREFTG